LFWQLEIHLHLYKQKLFTLHLYSHITLRTSVVEDDTESDEDTLTYYVVDSFFTALYVLCVQILTTVSPENATLGNFHAMHRVPISAIKAASVSRINGFPSFDDCKNPRKLLLSGQFTDGEGACCIMTYLSLSSLRVESQPASDSTKIVSWTKSNLTHLACVKIIYKTSISHS
jgi:hypothetical protein